MAGSAISSPRTATVRLPNTATQAMHFDCSLLGGRSAQRTRRSTSTSASLSSTRTFRMKLRRRRIRTVSSEPSSCFACYLSEK